jgi:tryptophan synthase alpha chain
MNRINKLFQDKSNDILSLYFTAGHPEKGSIENILQAIESSGVDLVEIGMPFSDPLADGNVIQQASQKALDNGMTLKVLFEELSSVRSSVSIPLLLMGYFNTVLQFGVEAFCKKAAETGIDGVILPDLPLEVYENEYKNLFEQYGIIPVFLITPQTSEERIRKIESLSKGFVYMVSSASTTGAKAGFTEENMAYFKRIYAMGLSVPVLTGFGISNAATRKQASAHSNGVIVGSAFVKHLEKNGANEKSVNSFVKQLLI